ncbi:MAG TPA: Sec-independent protein translocase protein TatB [Zoogloea sp.]|jgi:sec-independent protein translocase protein TatB|nr:Sec-independent protein translocase protein TatB [Zoogloea sp.]
MFDVGFSELMVIGIVALLVLGPERLPKVARTTGHLLGRLQRYVSDVKSDISREMQLDELKRLQEEARQSAISLESTVRNEMAGIEKGVSSSLQSASSAVADLENSIKAPVDGSAAASSFDHDAASAQLDRQLAEADTHAGPAPSGAAVAEEPRSEPVPPEPKSIKS